MTIQQLLERLIAISVINPDAEIVIEQEEGLPRRPIEEVNYCQIQQVFVVNGEDTT